MLNKEKVNKIVDMDKDGIKSSEIAKEIGVSYSMVRRVLTGLGWNNYTGIQLK